MFRSKYAEATTPTEVELVFSYAGKTYTVKRNPEYERPKSRGEGFTTQKAEVQLKYPDGRVVTKQRDVDNAIRDIMGINRSQFLQIAMIAQGDFLKLLLATTEERKKIFRQIFKTQLYQDLQDRLKKESSQLNDKCDAARNSIKQYIDGITCDENDVLSIEVEKAKNGLLPAKDVMDLIDRLLTQDNDKKTAIQKLQLYSEYIGKYEVAKKLLDEKLSEYYNALQELIDQLEKRLANISHPVEFLSDKNCDNDIEEALNRLNLVLNENNSYAGELKNKQTSAKTVLRLKEVEDFCNTIDYRAVSEKIEKLKSIRDAAESKLNDVKDDLSNKQEALDGKKRLLNDEELGAKHVNEYLNDFFGHHFVTLEAHKDNDDAKQIKFCIMRNGKPAYNLSEGECSLISFCYFMAKLDDVATSGQKPIIWIDDPISSLDSNHIYFIFSLIVSKIAKTGCFSQLFISTHNLDFLKYLNRLKSYHLDKNGKQTAASKAYFLIERIGNHSSIQALPQYLKSNATEYNYLFSQIYKVSQCVAVTDDNYDMLYSFGNSARKFLEMYLYFKYPTDEDLLPKLKRFFDPEDVPPILINRLLNEDSHGPTPENSLRTGIDPETIPVAKKILQLLQKDSEQYSAFMESIS